MIKTFAIINQKGGVGKSTTAQALGMGLHRRGFRVLFIDLDSQSNLSFSLRVRTDGENSMDVLTEDMPIKDAIVPLPNNASDVRADVLPGSPALALSEQKITGVGNEFKLSEALDKVKDDYDYIVIDTPPALGTLTINALTAATGVILPAQADIYSFQGISQLHKTILAVRRYCNPNLVIEGILLTRYTGRAVLTRDIANMIRSTAKQIGTRLFNTAIRESVTIREAQANQLDIFDYAPKSGVAIDYEKFINELLEVKNGKEKLS